MSTTGAERQRLSEEERLRFSVLCGFIDEVNATPASLVPDAHLREMLAHYDRLQAELTAAQAQLTEARQSRDENMAFYKQWYERAQGHRKTLDTLRKCFGLGLEGPESDLVVHVNATIRHWNNAMEELRRERQELAALRARASQEEVRG